MTWCTPLVDYVKFQQMIKSDDVEERLDGISEISINFAKITNKEQITKDLLALVKDENSEVRKSVAEALGSVLGHLTDKEQAWKSLLVLKNDNDNYVRWAAIKALCSSYNYFADEREVFNDLLVLLKDQDSYSRRCATETLGLVFANIPDKYLATEALLTLKDDIDNNVRWSTAEALGSSFAYVTDKYESWKVLHALSNDNNSNVRWSAINALGSAFVYITDKYQATETLLECTKDIDSYVRLNAAKAIGLSYVHLTNKNQALEKLNILTQDEDSDVRVYANYSLGRIFIYKATVARNDDKFKEHLEKAIDFFEESSNQSRYSNATKFCLPFYRSYYSIIFKQHGADEINKNLEEAKQAVAGSESREKLLEAIENLANALKEVQNLKDLTEIKSDLNTYMRYCNRAAELLDETGEKAPGATNLVRKGLPIIDEKLKRIITEIQKKTETLCKETIDTPLEDLGREVNRIGMGLLRVKDPIGLEKSINNLEMALSDICDRMSGKEKVEACKLLEKSKNEQFVEDKIDLINMVLTKIPSSIKEETEHELSNGDTFNIQADQVTVTSNKNSEISEQNSGIMSTIHTKPIRKIIEVLSISFTIAGVIWGIIYAILSEIGYVTAMRESLIIFSFTFILILFVSAKKR